MRGVDLINLAGEVSEHLYGRLLMGKRRLAVTSEGRRGSLGYNCGLR